MSEHIFVGFGFGPIQSGLFVSEAFKSGNFKKIVIAEIDQKLVDAVRSNNGSYYVNVATSKSIEVQKIDGIEMLNPTVESDRVELIKALSQATEIATSLPSVKFFDMGENSVASLIKQGLENSTASATIVYTAENNNHAAEILEEKVGSFENVQFLNTVIGKMSQVVVDVDEIKKKNLKPMAPEIDRAFLVEEFNKILAAKCNITGFTPGIKVFLEKEDLLPFEEAKLYGHNAIHASLAYLGAAKGYKKMADLKSDAKLMQIANNAFINESGKALIKKYENLNDELFTADGYKAYADDLLERMTNPYLDDTIDRAARDPQRKLGLNDRIFGTMALALEYGVEPVNMAKGAVAGIAYLLKNAEQNNLPEEFRYNNCPNISDSEIKKLFNWLWGDEQSRHRSRLIECTKKAADKLD